MKKNLPKGWGSIRFSDVANIFNGKTPSNTEKMEKGWPVLKIKDITQDGQFIGKFDSFVDDEFYKKHNAKRIKQFDSLILNAAHSSTHVGSKMYLASREVEDAIATGEWLIIRANSNKLDLKYKHYLLQAQSMKQKIKSLIRGIHLYPKDVQSIKIPLPPLPVQHRIAEILEKADALRQKRKKVNELADQFLQSVFLEMFGDTVMNPMGWEIDRLENLCKEKGIICGPFGSQLKIGEYINKGIPVYGIDNVEVNQFVWAKPKFISREKYKELCSFRVEPYDILITRTGTVGRTCIVPENIEQAIIGPNLLRVRLDQLKLLPIFFTSLLSFSFSIKEEIKRMSPGATVAVFNTTNLKKLKIPLPPLDLQRKFASIVDQYKNLEEKNKYNSTELENLFSSLLQRAFTGDLTAKWEEEHRKNILNYF